MLDWLRSVYKSAAANPEAFGMPSLLVEENWPSPFSDLGPVGKNEAKARKSFFRLPGLLLALARSGKVMPNGGLLVQKEQWEQNCKALKVTNPTPFWSSLPCTAW